MNTERRANSGSGLGGGFDSLGHMKMKPSKIDKNAWQMQ